jgi:hypothetical protein
MSLSDTAAAVPGTGEVLLDSEPVVDGVDQQCCEFGIGEIATGSTGRAHQGGGLGHGRTFRLVDSRGCCA